MEWAEEAFRSPRDILDCVMELVGLVMWRLCRLKRIL